MSKLVCNVGKSKGVQLYGMDIHIQRKTDNHSNKDIDLSRKDLNYELVTENQNEHYYTRAKNRIEQGYTGKKKIRKDGVWTANIIISSDSEFFKKLTPEQEREFFKTAYDFYCEKYGKENVISAMVHKDETTPHLHLLIVPLTKDGRLCAKELFDRETIRSFHDTIPKLLQQRGFDIERGKKNANVKRMETDEFKRIREQNKLSISINPNDVEPQKDGLFKKEPPEEIAQRLTQKYVKALIHKALKIYMCTNLRFADQRVQQIKNGRRPPFTFFHLHFQSRPRGSKLHYILGRIGIWGQRHLDYLKQYRKVTYTNLLTSGRLNAYLADINRQAQERFERLIEGMKQAQGITEQLKAENALEWTGCLNNIRACAREIVEKEIIFA
ncbi:MobV family relaxase [Campylobacter coli]|uniref:MobV family relaxase n=2 Tax=Campylobacter TaxID=194 RepID=UPI003D2FF401